MSAPVEHENPDCHEAQRVHAVQATRLVGTGASEEFDRITRLTAQVFDMPAAMVSLVTSDRQWIKSRVGLDLQETDRDTAFCAFTIAEPTVLVVEDATLDERFKDNPFVADAPGIRFYAGAPLLTRAGHALGTLCVIDYAPRRFTAAQCRQLQDMAELVMAQIDLRQAAGRINEVTRLPNREQLSIDLHHMATGATGQLRTMVMVDVMSHQRVQSAVLAVGIEAVEAGLRVVAARLKEVLGDGARLYHVSETRFVFLLDPADAERQAAAVEDLLARFSAPLRIGSVSIRLEIECGIADVDVSAPDADDAIRKATSAMLRAAKSQVAWLAYEPGFDTAHRRAYAMAHAIPKALANGEFRLVYQPKLDLHLGRYTAVEALLRWDSPKWGPVSPGEFIPVVEDTLAIHQVTHWVLDAALRQAALWQRQGLYLSVAVNVSANNLEHLGFVESVRSACALHAVDPRYLHIECTENAVLTGQDILPVLQSLRGMGIQISLDDFGIGYSNLACLHSLPIGLIKLDQSLVKPIVGDFRAWTLLQSLVSLGHTLGYRVLAEGVETAEIYDQLADAGCDAMQGYYLSRPIEADAVPPFMREQKSLARKLSSSANSAHLRAMSA